jgi:hypothetical protein
VIGICREIGGIEVEVRIGWDRGKVKNKIEEEIKGGIKDFDFLSFLEFLRLFVVPLDQSHAFFHLPSPPSLYILILYT